ncbi:TolC family outer membrane protein [Thalassotalea sp. G20_0]|uniref:TolC family outer membrane protein n=1 Tax=Thalassotalea sp. G20_0 TaxID=2821093 RepID=UPI001ADAF3A3|nr:TolC family outer membrane protein [Thalassotalea sp. G20_0]MBO9495069.1 TolC family outer membrane protein [Thalassotalea sp. G20_0]
MNRFQFLLISVFSGLLGWNADVSAESLEEALGQALRSNPEAKVALSRLKAERKNIDAVAADFWPTIDLAAGIGRQQKDTSPDTDGDKLTRKEASFSLRQNLFAGFNTWYNVKGARKGAEAEHWRLYSTLEDLALQVINVYLKVLERRDLVELAEENLGIHHEIFDQIERRARQGVARSSDLIQVEGRRARANANLISARNNLMDAESEYRALVGHSPGDLEFPGFAHLDLPEDLHSAIKNSKQDHPSVKAAEMDVESSEYAYSSRKSSYLPSLDAELDQSWRRNADGQLGDYGDTVAMVRLRYNLFRGGGDQARLLESAHQAEERRSEKARVMRDVEERMRISWAALQFIGAQREYLLLHEDASRDTVAAYREQFNIGKRTLLDLLDSENELFQSSNSLTSAIYQETYARYRVLAAVGRLLENVEFSIPKSWHLDG